MKSLDSSNNDGWRCFYMSFQIMLVDCEEHG